MQQSTVQPGRHLESVPFLSKQWHTHEFTLDADVFAPAYEKGYILYLVKAAQPLRIVDKFDARD